MTLGDLRKSPFPYFGGKADAAPAIWEALGDPHHYVEPFAGSLAVLMRRPHEANRAYYSETVNDIDGLLVNVWRSIQLSPDETARHASWPVSEADLCARHLALIKWRKERNLELLMGDPDYHDPRMAGWWIWGLSSWIGSGWCSGTGPWAVGVDGRIVKQGRGIRDAGVSRQRPHIGDDGQGVNAATARMPGVDGRIVKQGRGIRDAGVNRQLPHIGNDGQGVNTPTARMPGVGDSHPMTMPEILRWFAFLSARLRHVRILNGGWERALTNSATKTLSVRNKKGSVCGVFLDPPYSDTAERASGLYAHDDEDVAHKVRQWCVANGDDPKYRIVLAGFEVEHRELENHGWRVAEWFKGGFLKGGMGNTAGTGKTQMGRERLWISPHCLVSADDDGQMSILGACDE